MNERLMSSLAVIFTAPAAPARLVGKFIWLSVSRARSIACLKSSFMLTPFVA
jgi:hypothetical protein